MPDGVSGLVAEGRRVAVLAPPPLSGSGGHRTIYRNLNALAEVGFPIDVYLEHRRMRPGWLDTARTRRWFGVSGGVRLIPGWPAVLNRADLVLATTWQSALHLGEVETPGIKTHFVQDYECLFFPEDDERHALARSVHDLGFASITIGNWLVEVLSREHGINAWPTPFSADLELYGVDPEPLVPKREMVVANYQPEKPRRCPELMEKALQLVLDEDPSVEVVTFGSRSAPRLTGNHRHLGLVEPTTLAALYHEARVGLSMSATNPSRVPFEMMASGLPVVELGGANTVQDLPDGGSILVGPQPATVAQAITELLSSEDRARSIGNLGRAFMKNRPGSLERSAFTDNVTLLLCGADQDPPVVDRLYTLPIPGA